MLTRLLQADPELPQAACVIFDEFHERSLQADLGLALCLESRAALRPDLRLLVMSATLDVQAVAHLLGDCPGLNCAGRSFPVETRWLPPRGAQRRMGAEFWRHTAAVILQLLREKTGSLLAFLPGAGEIRQVAALLEERLPPDARLYPLYGNLSAREQDAAIAPAELGTRKVVLATSIAETSLTIEGVRLVVDAGLERSARFDPACGLSRLVTGRVSLAGAAQQTLYDLGALDERGRATSLGRKMAALPSSPRLARLLLYGRERGHAALACCLAALLVDRDPLLRSGQDADGTDCDLGRRLDWLCRGRDTPEKMRLRRRARRLADSLGVRQQVFDAALTDQDAAGTLLALAWPEWLAQRLSGDADRPKAGRTGGQLGEQAVVHFLLRSGRAAQLPQSDPLASREFLAVAAVSGGGPRGRIRLAAPFDRPQLEELFGHQISSQDCISVSDDGAVLARRQQMLGRLLLWDAPLPRPDAESCVRALCEYLRQGGGRNLARLPWSDEARQWRARVALLRELDGSPWPDLSDHALLKNLEDWLAP